MLKCSDLNKEGTPELVDTRGSCRRFSIFEKIKKRKHVSKKKKEEIYKIYKHTHTPTCQNI